MNNKKKLHDLEILRAMAIIMIVYIHFAPYFGFGLFYQFLVPINKVIVEIGLSLFFFVSGFVLYYNYPKISLKNLENFYYKRAKRIYPLYWLTVILGYGLSFFLPWNKLDISSLLIIVFGLQGIFPPWVPNAITLFWLWFVGVLLVYYIIYPVFTRFKSIIHIFLTAITIFIIILSLESIFDIMRPLVSFYWLFFLGIALCWLNGNYKGLKSDINGLFSKNNRKKLFSSYIFPILLVILIIFSYSKLNLHNHFDLTEVLINILKSVCYTIIIYTAVRILIYYITKLHNAFFKSKSFDLIKKISISSYATYLIHPIIIGIFKEIFSIYKIAEVYTCFLVVFFVFPVSFLVGYYLQVWEIKLTKKVSKMNDIAAEPKKI